MKTSDAKTNGGKCPKCDGRTTQDKKKRDFVRHPERFSPTDPTVPTNEKGQCRYGHRDVDGLATMKRSTSVSGRHRLCRRCPSGLCPELT